MTEIKKPIVLAYDLETSPCLSWVWSTGKQNVGANQILRPGKIICVSYRFLHWPEGKVKNLRWKKKKRDNRFSIPFTDKELVIKFAKIAAKADILVGHNSDNFDNKWLNTRLAYYRQPTLRHHMTEDTLKQARRQFRLPSFRLDFLCKYFNIPGKLSTPTGLWQKVVFDGCPDALDTMVSYCDNDVLIQAALYEHLYDYVHHTLNLGTFNGLTEICPQCGSKHRQKRGYRYTNLGKFQAYICLNCHHWYRDGANLLPGGKYVGR